MGIAQSSSYSSQVPVAATEKTPLVVGVILDLNDDNVRKTIIDAVTSSDGRNGYNADAMTRVLHEIVVKSQKSNEHHDKSLIRWIFGRFSLSFSFLAKTRLMCTAIECGNASVLDEVAKVGESREGVEDGFEDAKNEIVKSLFEPSTTISTSSSQLIYKRASPFEIAVATGQYEVIKMLLMSKFWATESSKQMGALSLTREGYAALRMVATTSARKAQSIKTLRELRESWGLSQDVLAASVVISIADSQTPSKLAKHVKSFKAEIEKWRVSACLVDNDDTQITKRRDFRT